MMVMQQQRHTITQADLDAGKVTITVSDENALSDGNHVLTTTVKDAAGNDESESQQHQRSMQIQKMNNLMEAI